MRIGRAICAVLSLLWVIPSALAQSPSPAPAAPQSPASRSAVEAPAEKNPDKPFDKVARTSPLPVVMELFTSQGCSSCPPADELFASYAAQPEGVIALSFSVDYWDHLGWRDTLASPKNTARQRAYAKSLGTGNVYTPQMVINGAAQVVGSKRSAIDKAVQKSMHDGPPMVPVKVANDGTRTTIEIGRAGPSTPASPSTSPSGTVWLVKVIPHVSVEIKRGENTGKKMSYFNVVREISPVGMWSGKEMRIELPSAAVTEAGHRGVILLQAGETGPILGATWMAN